MPKVMYRYHFFPPGGKGVKLAKPVVRHKG